MTTFAHRLSGPSRHFAFGGLLLASALSSHGQSMNATQGQDFQQIAPKQPPKSAPGKIVNEAPPKTFLGKGGEVLVAKLNGIVLLSDPKQVQAKGIANGKGVDASKVPLANRPSFKDAVNSYLGKPVTMTSLAELTRSMVSYFREHDRPVVNVYVPEQSITSGVVQIVVVESRVGTVGATGAKWFSNTDLREEVRVKPGDPISANEMREDLDWINRNPFLQSDMLLSPGNAPGTTDLVLRTKDRFPLRVYGGFDNTGNQYTGENRYMAGFNYGNLFGLGQQLSYQFSASPDFNQFYAHSGTYIVPLPWRHELTIFGSYSEANANVNGIQSGGVNWQISGRYEIPLPGTAQFKESVTAGFDFKRSNNSLAFGVLFPPLPDTNTDIDQFVLSYQGSYLDAYGKTSFSATGYLSPGGFTNYNNTSDFQTQRTGAQANYVYGQLALNRVTRLPMDFTWTVRGLLQGSDANLLPSEQIGLGGYDTVRGYQMREVNGDNGFLVSTEVATPAVSLTQFLGIDKISDQLQFIAFVDYGGTTLHDVTVNDPNPSSNLLSVGPGLRYVVSPYISVRFDYGFQLINSGLGNGEHSRADFGVLVSY